MNEIAKVSVTEEREGRKFCAELRFGAAKPGDPCAVSFKEW